MVSRDESLTWLQRRIEEYRSNENNIGEVVEDFDDMVKLGSGFVSSDELDKVDIRDGKDERPMYNKSSLDGEPTMRLFELLREFANCFAWSYTEMLGLDKELVELLLPIKRGFRPYKQQARNFNPKIVGKIKKEVDRLLQAKFIRPCRYAEWVSIVVPV
jgi:hypothetical protein